MRDLSPSPSFINLKLASMGVSGQTPGSPFFRRALWPALMLAAACLTVLWLMTTPVYDLSSDDLTYEDSSVLKPKHLAVVIETKETPNLVPLMLHFSNILGPDWPVVLFTLEASWSLPESPSFRRAVDAGRILIRFLPPETAFTSSLAVSLFLTQEWFWTQLMHAERVLLFQTDSVICSKSHHTLDEFLEYDFIGAPIAPQYGAGYNGGLSLRNPRLFLDVVRSVDRAFDGNSTAAQPERRFEDQWFYTQLKGRNGTRLPEKDVAKTFAVETIYHKEPLGYHQPSRWQKWRMNEIAEYCPEVNMLIGRRAT